MLVLLLLRRLLLVLLVLQEDVLLHHLGRLPVVLRLLAVLPLGAYLCALRVVLPLALPVLVVVLPNLLFQVARLLDCLLLFLKVTLVLGGSALLISLSMTLMTILMLSLLGIERLLLLFSLFLLVRFEWIVSLFE